MPPVKVEVAVVVAFIDPTYRGWLEVAMREDVAVRPDVRMEFGEVEDTPVPPAGTETGGNETAIAFMVIPRASIINNTMRIFFISSTDIRNIKFPIFHKVPAYFVIECDGSSVASHSVMLSHQFSLIGEHLKNPASFL